MSPVTLGLRRFRTARPLVGGFIERISSVAFSQYPKELTGLVGKQHGVYALYKKDRLYYAGLATNLRNAVLEIVANPLE